MQMDTSTSKEDKELQSSRKWLTELALRQLHVLEEASDAIDRKAGGLLGFIAVGIPLALQLGIPENPHALDFLFTYGAFAALFASLIALVLCLGPQSRRLDPHAQKLLDQLWEKRAAEVFDAVATNAKSAWQFNQRAHDVKVFRYAIALWLTLTGMALLAFEVLVIRVAM